MRIDRDSRQVMAGDQHGELLATLHPLQSRHDGWLSMYLDLLVRQRANAPLALPEAPTLWVGQYQASHSSVGIKA